MVEVFDVSVQGTWVPTPATFRDRFILRPHVQPWKPNFLSRWDCILNVDGMHHAHQMQRTPLAPTHSWNTTVCRWS